MIDWQRFATPEQMQALARIRPLTQKIQVKIICRDDGIQLKFSSDDPEAKQVIPVVREAATQSIAGTLNTLFGITGEILE